MQMTGDRAGFPIGTAVSGRSTADSLGINGPFTECDALMRERDALVYHRRMLERKRIELEQSLQKQRREKEMCPALFVFPSAEDLLRASQSDRVSRTLSTHGTAHQCVRNSAALSSWSTPIGSGVGAAGLTEYQKSFHAHYLMQTPRHVKEIYLCLANHVAAMHTLITSHRAPMLRRLESVVHELSEDMVQYFCQLETARQLEYVSIRLYRRTHALKMSCRLSRICSLDLSHMTCITKQEISFFSKCCTLVNIEVSCCNALINMSHLSCIETLEVINLSYCWQIIHVRELGRLPALKELYLSSTCITDEEVNSLKSLREQLGLAPIKIIS